MKVNKKLTGIAVLSAIAAAGAHAQSSVTLYGILDSGLTYVNNVDGHSKVFLDSGINQQNVWGLIGREDLGGGLSAIFNLEGGFSVTNGVLVNPAKIFDRKAYVGIASSTYGSIKLGEDFDYLFRNVTFYTNVAQFGAAYSFHLAYDVDRLAGESVSNAVDYETPTVAGASAGVMYGFSNVPGAFGGAPNNPRVISAGFSYAPNGLNGPFTFAAAYTRTDGENGTLAQIAFGGNRVQTFGAGARGQIGAVSVNAVYTYTNQTLASGAAMITRNYEIGTSYAFAPDLSAGVGFSYIDQTHQKYNIVSAGGDYRLSKSTDVYLFGSYQRAFAGSANAGNFLVVTPTTTDGYSSTGTQAVVQVGIRHLF